MSELGRLFTFVLYSSSFVSLVDIMLKVQKAMHVSGVKVDSDQWIVLALLAGVVLRLVLTLGGVAVSFYKTVSNLDQELPFLKKASRISSNDLEGGGGSYSKLESEEPVLPAYLFDKRRLMLDQFL